MRTISRLTAVAASVLLATCGMALAGAGQPTPWQLGLQDSVTPVMDDIVGFHDLLLWIITAISGFGSCCDHYRKSTRRNGYRARRTIPCSSARTGDPGTPVFLWYQIPSVSFFTSEPPNTSKATGGRWEWFGLRHSVELVRAPAQGDRTETGPAGLLAPCG